MKGARIDAAPKGDLAGIPVNMTKPQFEVSHLPGASPRDEATTTITVKYVADRQRRYVLNIDPNWLTSSGMGISLGPDGQLRSINASGASNATAIVQTVGKIAKAAAAHGFLDEDSPFAALGAAVTDEAQIATSSAPPNSCLKGEAYDATLIVRRPLASSEKAIRAALAGRLAGAKAVPAFQEQFHYFSDDEFRLLKAVRCSLEEQYVKKRKGLRDQQAGVAATMPAALLLAAQALATTATTPAKPAVERNSALARLRKLLQPKGNEKWRDYATVTSDLANLEPAAPLALASTLVDMPLAEWRRRRVTAIQGEIDDRSRRLAQLGCDGRSVIAVNARQTAAHCNAALRDLAAAQEELASTVGRLNEYRLGVRLDEQIARLTRQRGDADPAMYQKLRAASNVAKTDVTAARDAALKSASAAAPALLKRDAVLMLTARAGEKADAAWVLDAALAKLPESASLPDFVIVLNKENEQ